MFTKSNLNMKREGPIEAQSKLGAEERHLYIYRLQKNR